jgi:hypothetical protein
MSATATPQENRELTRAISAAMVEFSRLSTSATPPAPPATPSRSARRDRTRPLRPVDQHDGGRHISRTAGRDGLRRVRLGLRKLRASLERDVA